VTSLKTPKKRGRSQTLAPELDPVNPESAEPIERQVYKTIRQALMSGVIAPGTVLTSRSLAQRMKVSAQPVRDALKRLEADGILEGLAGWHATSAISDDAIDRLRQINGRMELAGSTREYLAENFRFHFLIYSEADKAVLLALIENLWIRIGPHLHHHPNEFNRADTLKKHQEIIDALVSRDPDAVQSAIASDLGSATEQIVKSLR
jgi:GntR family colanic acid and biofilm gene transcriptional regulator